MDGTRTGTMSSIRKMATLPSSFRKLVVTNFSNNFRQATEIQTSLGEVVAVGSNVKHLSVGQPVACMNMGSYSEYQVIPSKSAIPLPDLKPEYIALMASGITADLAFTECGPLKEGQKVLVTAAAGGTGQFAVQLAKLAGCHTIGTCSTDQKAAFLKNIGCDRPINYNKEDLKTVLRTEYKDGVDVIYESVGGDVFDICFNALARHGRLLVIGAISSYNFDAKPHSSSVLPRLPLSYMYSGKNEGKIYVQL
ncbi:Prostaglandin reductase-3 [Holothuria leucospilota]|uniref:15-oxoprostaglandin 13-reductase n=1 Tax=Holothuria leucospilota TaxID=206669 RepID=A0A9Q1BQK4_HOLLE|nr:Prostaglandin reductase-3 [Holothuria leucospilota]